MTMFSPKPCWFFRMRFSRPSPKATSRETETVPQVIPKRVSTVRTFWCRTSCSICRRKDSDVMVGVLDQSAGALLDLLGRPLDHQVLLVQALRHLHDHAVGKADLDRLLDRLRIARTLDLHRLLALGGGHQPLGALVHGGLRADRAVGVAGVPRAH